MIKETIKKIAPACIIVLTLCAVVFNLSVGRNARADDPAPYVSYKIELDNGSVFYMTVQGEENASRLKSGLYTKTGQIIYLIDFTDTVESFLYKSSVVFSEGGICFAYFPWAWFNGWGEYYESGVFDLGKSGTALMFFKNGVLLKKYSVGDLLQDPEKGSYSVSHVMWEKGDERRIDPVTNTLCVTAKDNSEYIFDMNTGLPGEGTGGGNTTAQPGEGCSGIKLPDNGAALFAAIVVMFFVKKRF